MAAFDSLLKAQFAGLYFPVEGVAIDGVQRIHVHEYPHTDGGKLERLGRKPYNIRFMPIFDEGIVQYDAFNNGRPLYPDVLVALHQKWVQGEIGDLVIPTMGTISAFMVGFKRSMAPNLRSGERVELDFIEVMNERFRLGETVVSDGRSSIAAKHKAISVLPLSDPKGPRDNIFDKIDAAVNRLLAVQDQGDLFLSQVSAKVEKLTNLISLATQRVEALQQPENWRVLEAYKELWFAANEAKRAASERVKPHIYHPPHEMTIQEVAMAIFGSTDRTMELLQMNVIENADAIPRNFPIRFIGDTSHGLLGANESKFTLTP